MTILQAIVVGLAFAKPDGLVQGHLIIPLLNVIAPLATTCALAAFAAWFVRTISDRVAVFAIVVNVIGVILFHAAIQSYAGVICGAVCPKGEFVEVTEVSRNTLGEGYTEPEFLKAVPEGADGGAYIQVARDFWTSLYFSVVTLTTLGYGDFQPLPQLRMLASFEALSGYLILGLLVGLLIDFGARHRDNDHTTQGDEASESAECTEPNIADGKPPSDTGESTRVDADHEPQANGPSTGAENRDHG